MTYSIVSIYEEAISIITANIKGYYQRKKIENYLSKLHCSYKITTSIDNGTNIKMVVYLSNGFEKEFKLEYDPFSNRYVLFIQRNTVTESIYKFNFVADSKVIIDSSFALINEKERYLNIINFTQINKNEEEKMQSDKMQIRYLMGLLRNKNENSMFRRSVDFLKYHQISSENVTNTDDDIEDKYQEGMCSKSKKMSSSCIRKKFLHKSFTMTENKMDLDYVMLTRPKSILKNLRRESNNSLITRKKVSFQKKVEYSI